MKYLFHGLFICVVIIFGFFIFVHRSYSDELDDISKQITQLTESLNSSIKATKPLESELTALQNQILGIKQRVNFIEQDIAVKKKNIDQSYKDLVKQQAILNKAISDFYIKSYYNSPLITFLSADSASEITQALAYQKAATDQDKAIITNIALTIADLEMKKKNLEDEQTRLIAAKTQLDAQSAKLDEVVKGAKAYQAQLSSQIAQLSQRQQDLLAQKLASLNIPRSAYTMLGGCTDDRDKDPGFSPRLAFYTYGVPNRVGLSQFGAWGRAKNGQDYPQILQAYYNFDSISGANQSTQIRVDGHGSYSLEDYVKRIYEVPDSWTDNNLAALKAQAIAARSYALAYTNNGSGSICATDQCQVFQDNPKGGNWEAAVNATSGKVMMQGSQVIKAWFSSTHGGYIHSSSDIGWGGTSFTKNSQDASGGINNFSDLQNNAYDKASPWFYCDWGSRASYNKTAWLKPEEVADIVNILLLAQKDSSTQKHLSQTDKPNPDGVDTWDSSQVKQELRNRGITPFDRVSDISVNADFGSGKTTTVTVNGSQSFSGNDFKNYFNLRAPANINIVGPLYNIEKR